MKAPVLVVDDHAGTVGILKALLTRLGFEAVEGCADAGSAYDLARSKTYGLIISDWNMPQMSGHELLQRLRAQPEPHTPFVMMTGEVSAERVVAARSAGAADFLVKPFDTATLKARLVGVLGEF